jgi:hypothetical protein
LKDMGAGLCAVTEMAIAPEVILGMVGWNLGWIRKILIIYFGPKYKILKLLKPMTANGRWIASLKDILSLFAFNDYLEFFNMLTTNFFLFQVSF